MNPNKIRIPKYVSAVSPDGLRRAMLLQNLTEKAELQYFDLQHVNGRWYAWFYPISGDPIDARELTQNADIEGQT